MSKLTPDEARAIGENRETWCAVEPQKEESWCRKQRKHYRENFNSCVFDAHNPGYEPRCTFAPDAPMHRERRHYREQNKSVLEI